MSEYVQIARERIDLAEQGKLRIRPMERLVYKPDGSAKSIPPQYIEIGNSSQARLFESQSDYQGEKDNESSV